MDFAKWKILTSGALSKNIVIYHRGERRVRRVLRLFQSLLRFSGASAFSVCSAVKFKDNYIVILMLGACDFYLTHVIYIE